MLLFNIYNFPLLPIHPRLLLFPAAGVGALLLSIKTLAVCVHGHTTQRLARIVAPYEGRCDASTS